MAKSEVIRKSVTRDDYQKADPAMGSVINFWMGNPLYDGGGLPARPPAYWSFARDEVLRSTVQAESMWSSAIYVAVTKMASLSWKTKGLNLRARRARDLLMEADGGRGWVHFLSRHLRDFLCTDNGAFIEIVRATSASGSKILGIMHLDSRRCQRTGDPEKPVIYRDRRGRYHELRSHEVISISDMPDAGDLWYGVGYCAASRAYASIHTLAALETYVGEKLSGRRPLAIHFVSNVSLAQIENAKITAENQRSAEGLTSYMGAIIVPNIDPTSGPQVSTVELAGLPDGFDADQERRKAYLIYANAIGLDPQEVDPQLLASRALGTGAQARVIDDKASGNGLVAWRQNFTHHMNEDIMPQEVTMSFVEIDLRDKIQKATYEETGTKTAVARVTAGIITPEQARQLMVDDEVLPREFLGGPDITPVTDESDTENPEPEAVTTDVKQPVSQTSGQPDVQTHTDASRKESIPVWAEFQRDRKLELARV